MEDKLKFREALSTLLDAAGDAHTIERGKVEEILAPFGLTPEQEQLVFAYLGENKIHVEGYDKEAMDQEDEKEQSQIEEGVSPEDLLSSALDKLTQEDRSDYDSYVEMIREDMENFELLKSCADLALPFAGFGIPLSDLIQEANVGLIMSQSSADLREEGISEEEYIREGIRDCLRTLLEEEEGLKDQDRKVLEKVNYITDVIHNMSDELGRKVSLEELSARLEMDPEEVKDILKLTGETFDEENGSEKKIADRKAEPGQETYGYLDLKDFKVY